MKKATKFLLGAAAWAWPRGAGVSGHAGAEVQACA